MQKIKVRVRKKGQITLPRQLRDLWDIGEGSEMVITAEGDRAVIKPVKRTIVREDAGSLGEAKDDEIEFAVIDPELILQYYLKKYGG